VVLVRHIPPIAALEDMVGRAAVLGVAVKLTDVSFISSVCACVCMCVCVYACVCMHACVCARVCVHACVRAACVCMVTCPNEYKLTNNF